MSGLVLSLFGGLGLLDEAFRLEGFTVVRGPDLLWSQDVRDFRPPAGVFEGVIGGPPCQLFSQLRYLNPNEGRRTRIGEMLHHQGLPETWLDDSPFTETAKRQMIGNGVPLPMGRAIARAVSRAMQREGVAS